ncbi:hypothetical protein GQ457_01G041260 [Hibiscus cannabinus]
MSEFNIPNTLLPSRRFKDAGSRPPDGAPNVPLSHTLERSTLPTPLDGQNEVKRSSTREGSEAAQDSMVLDADDDSGEQDSSTIMVNDLVSTDIVMEAQTVTPSSNNSGSTPVGLQPSPEGLSLNSAGVSYATMVAKNLRNIPGPGGDIAQDKVIVRDDDFVIDRTGKFPSIKFSDRVHEQIDANMSTSVIVRLLGRSIGYRTLVTRVHALWKPVGNIQVVDLDNNFFLVRFENISDYNKHRSFSTTENHLSEVVVWVRLPGLPYRYYNPELFCHIASVVGHVVKIDDNTAAGGRGRFARIVVLVDLNKPLLSCIEIDGKVQKLEYEGLNQICFGCGVYGHSKDSCARNTSKAPVSEVMPVAKDPPVSEPTVATPYGSWMVVDTRRRRPPPPQANPPKRVVSNASHERKVSGTRFSILAGNDDHGGSESNAFNPITGVKDHNSTSDGKASSGISFKEAYMTSNPQKKSKHVSRTGLIPDVVSIVDGEKIEVVPHVVNQQPDKHVAVAIVENVPRKAGLVGGKVTKQRGIVGRNLLDVRRGLPIKKPTEDLAQQLSAAKSTGCSSHGLIGVSSELSDKETSVSASGDGSTVDTGQVPTITEDASTVQDIMRQ